MLVLVVDDTSSNVIFMTQALRSLGHNVLSSSGGEAALKMLLSIAADVVLVDYHMPGMNAPEFINALKQCEQTVAAATPVVVMTADAAPAIKRRRPVELSPSFRSR